MISKRKVALGAATLVLVTSVSTFMISNAIQIPIKDKLIVSRKEYEALVDVYEKQSKAVALEEFIEENYIEKIDEKKLEDGQLKGMFEAIKDPYSVYMNKEEFKSFMEHTEGTFGGIGIVVKLGEDNLLTIEKTIEGGPSEKAGLKRGDKIVKVNEKEYKPSDYSNPMIMREEIVKAMRGEPGTTVKVTILRLDENKKEQYIEKEIKREKIRMNTVESQVLEDNIGYINISSFDEITADDFKKEIKKLKKQGIEGLVIDLRYNPGGILEICAEIADELMGEGTIVYTETRDKERKYIKSDSKKLGLPLAIVVNEESASASEILAAAIQDTKEGTIVGTKTFGKGIVQTVKPLSDGTGIKLTVSQYFTPNGRSIHKKGVEPDIVVKLPEDIEQIGPENLKEDTQLKKALEVVKSKIK
ncbi:carboxy-terminal processing protease CtpA [Gottschalkia acidurici 9a]|uniref:Carboxy-terminal processing protease CtpA n=1 Tax=Gottschalkia acidurici (strain ATCC 7906 / DSM 604 / BCRC 14475 / CIP 104303 / KCTC 5404 / NCIMB 10678 / 9a) TaxID=1128398 RepID=K0B2A5_GOTA9|nr:S41 family peptidase [Gottschalkia acidurici]AFS79060.1 carboxy-terminal processing protease CtpA [Gottschalkia acidurici 9a]